jgi:hypothetical protein
MKNISFWLRFDVWFVMLTVLYWLLVGLGLGFSFCIDSCSYSSNGCWAVNLIGLFVPIGPNNILLILAYLISIPKIFSVYPVRLLLGLGYLFLFVFSLLRGEKLLQALHFSPVSKVLVNLGILLLLSATLDILTLNSWMALDLLVKSLQ